MKAEELMIGDWVNYWNTDDGHAPYLEPVKITKDDFVLDEVTFFNTHIAPIPLTSEILEKNGFIKGYDGVPIGYNNNLKMYHKYINKAHIVVNYLDDGKVGIEISNEFSPKDDKGRADLVAFARDWCNGFCVHELQHALKLCGIDKEIVI